MLQHHTGGGQPQSDAVAIEGVAGLKFDGELPLNLYLASGNLVELDPPGLRREGSQKTSHRNRCSLPVKSRQSEGPSPDIVDVTFRYRKGRDCRDSRNRERFLFGLKTLLK